MKTIILLSALALYSCGGREDANIIDELPQNPPPTPDALVLTSTNKSALSSEVTGIINKNFTCDQSLVFNECYDAALIVVNVFRNDNNINTIARNLFISYDNRVTNRNTIRLAFDNTESKVINILRRHVTKWSGRSDNFNRIDELENYLQNETGVSLNCQVGVNRCHQAVDTFILAFRSVSNNSGQKVNRLVVRKNNKQVRLQGFQLFTTPNASVAEIRDLLASSSGSNINVLRDRIMQLSGKDFRADTQTSPRECVGIANKIIRLYESSQNIPITSNRFFICTVKAQAQSSSDWIEINDRESVNDILKKLKAHARRY